MLIVPGLPPLQHTRHTRELGRRLEQTVRDYQRDHPELTEAEIRSALIQSTPGGTPELTRRRRMFAIGLSAAIIGAFTALASNEGRFPVEGDALKIVGVVFAVAIGLLVLVLRSRRD